MAGERAVAGLCNHHRVAHVGGAITCARALQSYYSHCSGQRTPKTAPATGVGGSRAGSTEASAVATSYAACSAAARRSWSPLTLLIHGSSRPVIIRIRAQRRRRRRRRHRQDRQPGLSLPLLPPCQRAHGARIIRRSMAHCLRHTRSTLVPTGCCTTGR